jgi:hypothetical protein
MGRQIAIEESTQSCDFLEERRHLTEMKDGNFAATAAFTLPPMPHLGWEDPKMVLVEKRFIGVGKHGTTVAPQHGEKLPVITLMDIHRVQAEATNPESHVSQHGAIMTQLAEFVKRLTSTFIGKSG